MLCRYGRVADQAQLSFTLDSRDAHEARFTPPPIKLIGATRPACDAEVVVGNFPDLHGKMSVVYEIDDHLFEIDRAAAAGTSMLKALVGQAGEVSMEDRIANEIANIREVRQFASASNVFLLYRAEGETGIWNPSTTNEFAEFVVAIDGGDPTVARAIVITQKAIQGVIAASRFAVNSTSVDLPPSLK